MAKPILFINIDEDFFKSTTVKYRQKIIDKIKKETDNEYHVILHDGIKDVKCVNGIIPTKYF